MSPWTNLAIDKRVIRYADLLPCAVVAEGNIAAGANLEEYFSIVAGDAAQITTRGGQPVAQQGFGIAALRLAPGCPPTPRYSDEFEVLAAHLGHSRVMLGPNGVDGVLELRAGDVASIAPGTYWAVRNEGPDTAFVLVVTGPACYVPESPAPAIFAASADSAFVPIRDGRWIDISTAAPALSVVASARSEGDTDRVLPRAYIIAATDIDRHAAPSLHAEGVIEAPIVGAADVERAPHEAGLKHGFSMCRVTLQPGAYVPAHTFPATDAFFVMDGTLEVGWAHDTVIIGSGDTLSVPIGVPRALRNATSKPAIILIIRGSDEWGVPVFATMPIDH